MQLTNIYTEPNASVVNIGFVGGTRVNGMGVRAEG